MAENYVICRADLLRLVALLQRQHIGVKYDNGVIRVAESRGGQPSVTTLRFRPVEVRGGR